MGFIGAGPLDPDVIPMFLEDLHLDGGDSRAIAWGDEISDEAKADSPVVVIGCGEAGLLAGIRLAQAGLPFTIIEKGAGPGGTWWDNRYPGARVDIGSHFYCYSFEPADHWTEYFSQHPELRAYFRRVMEAHDLEQHCRWNTRVDTMTYDDATAFAAWRSKRDGVAYRLPTEEEWEYAARNGERGDLYPWGPDWKDKAAILKDATPSAVGSRPEGRNKWGVFDLIGNVWEWTASKASVYPGNRAKVPTAMQDWVTIRGGCYVSDPANSDAPVSSCLREFVPPSTKTTLLGFRLVRNQ